MLPLAGQGANLGLGDAAALAHQLESAISNGADIGKLRSYINLSILN
ncbi:unnamed protein product [Protopolystoma xenopodis]|uniref:HPt domain-containing protein n=1 Tax=Protopolystoma xenopodis TaxID=117903 RepID=A0A448X7D2_9PLAT|nr:unnamed protein product [Protopolystoma xenopodis]